MSSKEDKSRSKWLRALPVLGLLGAAVGAAWLFPDLLSFQALVENRETLETFRDSHYLQAVLVFIFIYIVIVAFSIPGATVVTLTGGFLFGTFPGVFFNVLGATIGAVLIFMAVRIGFGSRLMAKMEASGGGWRKVKDELDNSQWSILFFIRLVPVIPFFVANIIPGLAGVPLSRFVISTFLGILPGGLVYTSVGAGMGALLDRGETPDLGVIFEPQILLPLLGLSALSLLPVAVRHLKRNA